MKAFSLILVLFLIGQSRNDSKSYCAAVKEIEENPIIISTISSFFELQGSKTNWVLLDNTVRVSFSMFVGQIDSIRIKKRQNSHDFIFSFLNCDSIAYKKYSEVEKKHFSSDNERRDTLSFFYTWYDHFFVEGNTQNIPFCRKHKSVESNIGADVINIQFTSVRNNLLIAKLSQEKNKNRIYILFCVTSKGGIKNFTIKNTRA